MTEQYYISSNKYSLQERQTKRGRVYDVVFRIITKDGYEKQKRLSGFANKTLAQVTKTYAHLYEEDKPKIIARIT